MSKESFATDVAGVALKGSISNYWFDRREFQTDAIGEGCALLSPTGPGPSARGAPVFVLITPTFSLKALISVF